MEKILVTGATGFIGQKLVPRLVEQGYDVTVMHRYVTGRYRLGENVKAVFADLKDYSGVERAVKVIHPDRVINLAAISPVSYSYDHPQEVTLINYIGVINIAEACRLNVPRFKQFIQAGTSEEYGNHQSFPLHEDYPKYPNSPYAVAKTAATKYLEYMHQGYDFPMTVMRPFNTYGRSDNTHFVTERILSQMLRGEKEIRLGDPEPVRDLMYVDDHVEGYLAALGNPNALGHDFNLCTGKGYTIETLVKHCAKVVGWKGDVVWNTIPVRPLDIHTLIGSNTKAYKLLGWKYKVPLKEGLQKTINSLTT